MRHPLDRPVWTALTTRQAEFAEGNALAKRFIPSVVPFASTPDNEEKCLCALESIVPIGERIFLAQADEIALSDKFAKAVEAKVVQMIAVRRADPIPDARIEKLTNADAEEMLALATLTKPGPFTLRAAALGEFFGIKIDGRLAAMAGERMKQPGFSELSGVCSHPDFRGASLGKIMSLHVTNRIFARGETPYLHAYTTNAAAIRLYESIGFELRRELNVAVAERRP
jgi:ribosomal protein S18 acetylase RimI-like enzyme